MLTKQQSIRAVCPHCHQEYPVKEAWLGKTVKCKICKKHFQVRPVLEPAPIEPPAPPVPQTQPMSTVEGPRQYKVFVVREGFWGTLFFGASKLPIAKMERLMNEYSQDGYNLNFIMIESYRTMLFWTREAAIITMSKPLQAK